MQIPRDPRPTYEMSFNHKYHPVCLLFRGPSSGRIMILVTERNRRLDES